MGHLHRRLRAAKLGAPPRARRRPCRGLKRPDFARLRDLASSLWNASCRCGLSLYSVAMLSVYRRALGERPETVCCSPPQVATVGLRTPLRRYCRCEVGCVRSRDGDDGGVEVPTGSKTNDKIFARFLLEQLRELCTYTHTRVLRSTSISSMIKHLKRHTVLVHGPGSERYE